MFSCILFSLVSSLDVFGDEDVEMNTGEVLSKEMCC